MSATKTITSGSVTRRVSISNWQVVTPLGQPASKTSIGVNLMIETLDSNGAVVATTSGGFTISGNEPDGTNKAAAFMQDVHTRVATRISAGDAVPIAHLRAWRGALYAYAKAHAADLNQLIAADATVDDQS